MWPTALYHFYHCSSRRSFHTTFSCSSSNCTVAPFGFPNFFLIIDVLVYLHSLLNFIYITAGSWLPLYVPPAQTHKRAVSILYRIVTLNTLLTDPATHISNTDSYWYLPLQSIARIFLSNNIVDDPQQDQYTEY